MLKPTYQEAKYLLDWFADWHNATNGTYIPVTTRKRFLAFMEEEDALATVTEEGVIAREGKAKT